jgi:hypothetical protein
VQYLTIWDLVLTPFYLIILSLIARRYRDKKYPKGHPLRRYFLPGLYVKFAGVLFIALIYQYYYEGGDTYNFYYGSKIINSSLNESIDTWINLIARSSQNNNPALYSYTSQLYWYNEPASYTVSSIGAVLGLFNGTAYIPISLLFASLAYTGIWAMFKTFANIYPHLHKKLAIAFLFIPSTVIWGSAMFKDTICMFALGWMIYCTFRIFINRDFSLQNLLLLALSIYVLAVIKIYILMAFVPALMLWLLMTYSYKIKQQASRLLVNALFIAITIIGFLFGVNRFAKELGRYSLENVAKTSASTRGWITYASGDEGSAYSLGEFDPSLTGMVTKFPQAVVVTLFRPFIWESRKVIVLLSALEAMAFLYFTLRVIAKRKAGIFSSLKADPNLLFFLIFSLIFAFAVGISSYNFGALSRYKIPCLPFYAAFLLILYYNQKPTKAGKLVSVQQIAKPRQTSRFETL